MNSDLFSHLNWLSILAGALGYFLVGAIWYSFLFRDSWIRATKIDMNDPNGKKGVAGIMVTSFILMVVASLGIALLLSKTGTTGGWMTGAKVGLVVSVCFMVTAISNSYLYEKRPSALHFINGGYNVVGCVICGVIQAVWPW
jgi:hypothetical protein